MLSKYSSSNYLIHPWLDKAFKGTVVKRHWHHCIITVPVGSGQHHLIFISIYLIILFIYSYILLLKHSSINIYSYIHLFILSPNHLQYNFLYILILYLSFYLFIHSSFLYLSTYLSTHKWSIHILIYLLYNLFICLILVI